MSEQLGVLEPGFAREEGPFDLSLLSSDARTFCETNGLRLRFLRVGSLILPDVTLPPQRESGFFDSFFNDSETREKPGVLYAFFQQTLLNEHYGDEGGYASLSYLGGTADDVGALREKVDGTLVVFPAHLRMGGAGPEIRIWTISRWDR